MTLNVNWHNILSFRHNILSTENTLGYRNLLLFYFGKFPASCKFYGNSSSVRTLAKELILVNLLYILWSNHLADWINLRIQELRYTSYTNRQCRGKWIGLLVYRRCQTDMCYMHFWEVSTFWLLWLVYK